MELGGVAVVGAKNDMGPAVRLPDDGIAPPMKNAIFPGTTFQLTASEPRAGNKRRQETRIADQWRKYLMTRSMST
jgi:hypothetical protein